MFFTYELKTTLNIHVRSGSTDTLESPNIEIQTVFKSRICKEIYHENGNGFIK